MPTCFVQKGPAMSDQDQQIALADRLEHVLRRDRMSKQIVRVFLTTHEAEECIAALRQVRAEGAQGPGDVDFVAAVGRGELEPRLILRCPFHAGVSVQEYAVLSEVPPYWLCTCTAEHQYAIELVEVQFRRPLMLSPAPVEGDR